MVAGARSTPSSARSRAANVRPASSAPARSPAAASRSISVRCAGSSSGVSAHRRAARATAVAGSSAAAISASKQSMRWPRWAARAVSAQSSSSPGQSSTVPVGVIQVAHDRAERDGDAARDHRVGSERLAQRPHRGAQARPGMRAVGPETGGQRVAVVRSGVQRQERQQPQVQRRQRHQDPVALDSDPTEELHRQHPMTVPGLTLV